MVNILEKSVQEALERHYWSEGYTAKREVQTPVGYIDFILYKGNVYDKSVPKEKILVEVKEHKSIKHAIGQIYSYKKYHPDVTESRIVYFCRDGKYKPVDISYLTHDADLKGQEDKKIRIQCVHDFISLEDIYKWQNTQTTSRRNQESSESSKTSLIEMISPVVISEDIIDQTKIVKEESSSSKMTSIITDNMQLETLVNQTISVENDMIWNQMDVTKIEW